MDPDFSARLCVRSADCRSGFVVDGDTGVAVCHYRLPVGWIVILGNRRYGWMDCCGNQIVQYFQAFNN